MSRLANPLIERLILSVTELRRRALALEQTHHDLLEKVEPNYQDSARNLLHYLSLRQSDIRQVQFDLTSLGLSSLGRLEANTLSTLDAVLVALHRLVHRTWVPAPNEKPPVNFRTGTMLLNDHTHRLLGTPLRKRTSRIMVTMPSEAATDEKLVRDLLEAGMDVMRLNCAHDDREAWLAMIKNLRKAQQELGLPCKVYADLAGPKLRTGAIEAAGRVVKANPRRDFRGTVIRPDTIWLTPASKPQPAPSGIKIALPFPDDFLAQTQIGDEIEIHDCRGDDRRIEIVSEAGAARVAEASRTMFIERGAVARLFRANERIAESCVGELPEVMLPLRLNNGDLLILTKSDEPGQQAVHDEDGRVIAPARIPCTLKEAFQGVKPGEAVWFDDGKIGGEVVSNTGEEMTVKLTYTGLRGAKLGAEKGINFPDARLDISPLTPKDMKDLTFLVHHVDIVGLSFVRGPQDVEFFEERMHELGAGHLGIVLKIENRQAFENLPQILLTSLQSPPVGIMVARGDLATEIGFARLAEVQEEILWLCEAAHVPVIWATQVLEGLAKKGQPSRAEVSDAALGVRAECVMLNKGLYIIETVRFLSGVLERMQSHLSKQRAMLRKLSVSEID
jgi:pyruvate kinase